MIFVHSGTKSAAPDEYLLNHELEFVDLFFQFDVLGTSGARLAIRNDTSIRSENLQVGRKGVLERERQCCRLRQRQVLHHGVTPNP